LAEILDEEPPNWDKQKEYYSSNVDIYFVDLSAGLVRVDKESTLCQVMKGERYVFNLHLLDNRHLIYYKMFIVGTRFRQRVFQDFLFLLRMNFASFGWKELELEI
jgi:hypothetical protein